MLSQYADTSGDERSGTIRAGAGGRVYFARGGVIEPYAQLALGPVWFRDRSAACSVEGVLFGQAAVGAEFRVVEAGFVGGALSATQQGYGKSCGDVDETNWNTGPMFGLMVTLRFGPVLP